MCFCAAGRICFFVPPALLAKLARFAAAGAARRAEVDRLRARMHSTQGGMPFPGLEVASLVFRVCTGAAEDAREEALQQRLQSVLPRFQGKRRNLMASRRGDHGRAVAEGSKTSM